MKLRTTAIIVLAAAVLCTLVQGQERPATKSTVEVMSDSKSYDWKRYLSRMLMKIRQKWYERIPRPALPPERKHGIVTVQFAILTDGEVVDAKITDSSGDSLLDQAALVAIIKSSPLPRLPKEGGQERLQLRFTFTYNP